MDTPEAARAMTNRQTQSYLYEFDRNETRSTGTISLLVSADPLQHYHEIHVVNGRVPLQRDTRETWLHTMKVVPSTYHQMVDIPLQLGRPTSEEIKSRPKPFLQSLGRDRGRSRKLLEQLRGDPPQKEAKLVAAE